MPEQDDEDRWEKVEDAVRHEVDEIEVATLMTVDEIKDTVHDAVEKIKGLGHRREAGREETPEG